MGADLAAHRRIGPFEVLSELGRGGMGIVYKAYHSKLHRVVALKVLSPALADDKEFLQRFEREAQSAAALNHPNIVTVYDVGAEAGEHYIAMEYVDGPNLQQRLDAEGALEWTEALRIVRQALRGLDAAHRIGVVHRDIKPHNIILNGAGLVKIADFGLAKRLDDSVQTLTIPGLIVGSPAYMAPEQARGEELDARTDLFALGGVLYTLLSGHPPFAGKTRSELLRNILGENPTALRSIRADLPIPVARLVERALEKDPDNRFASAEEMGTAVDLTLAGMGETRRLIPEKAPARTRATGRLAVAVVIIVLCLGIVAMIARTRTAPPPETPAPPAPSATTPPGETTHTGSEIFRDMQLEDAARKALGLSPDEALDPARLATLTRLDASRGGITDLRGLERAKRLEHLNLSGNPLTNIEPLAQLPSLVVVDLHDIPGLDGNQLVHLRSLSNLLCIQFDGRKNVDAALEAISTMPMLELLSIHGGSSGTAAGVRKLERLETLRGLSLMFFVNPLDEALDAIGRIRRLDYLNLTGSNVTDTGMPHLAGLEHLRFFALGDTKITDAALPVFARLSGLKILILQREAVTDAGLDALAESPTLDYLCLLECRQVSDAGMKAIARAARLTTLNLLGCTAVTAGGVEALADAPALRELHIGPGPALESSGLQALATLPGLTHLVLQTDKPFSPARIDALLSLKSLRFLGFHGQAPEAEALGRLQSALPECEIRTRLDPGRTQRFAGPN
jgi:tRNA A-37 threonylcarbamoyl transferase component Bud32